MIHLSKVLEDAIFITSYRVVCKEMHLSIQKSNVLRDTFFQYNSLLYIKRLYYRPMADPMMPLSDHMRRFPGHLTW